MTKVKFVLVALLFYDRVAVGVRHLPTLKLRQGKRRLAGPPAEAWLRFWSRVLIGGMLIFPSPSFS